MSRYLWGRMFSPPGAPSRPGGGCFLDAQACTVPGPRRRAEGERHSALLSIVGTGATSLEAAASSTGTPHRPPGTRGRPEEKGTATPGRRGRRVGSGRIFSDESLEGLQYFIDMNPTSTPREMQALLSDSYRLSPDIPSISKLPANLKITNKKVVVVPAARSSPSLPAARRVGDDLEGHGEGRHHVRLH